MAKRPSNISFQGISEGRFLILTFITISLAGNSSSTMTEYSKSSPSPNGSDTVYGSICTYCLNLALKENDNAVIMAISVGPNFLTSSIVGGFKGVINTRCNIYYHYII